MGEMEPFADVLTRLRSKFPLLPQTAKPLSDGRTCRGSYNWLPQEEMERHMTDIVAIEDKQDLCGGCDGTCRQDTTRFFPTVGRTSTGLFSYALQMCRREEAKRE